MTSVADVSKSRNGLVGQHFGAKLWSFGAKRRKETASRDCIAASIRWHQLTSIYQYSRMTDALFTNYPNLFRKMSAAIK